MPIREGMPRERSILRLAAGMTILIAAASASGQERFEPVENGVADADPLSIGLRELQVDLRDPVGFEQVFRVPGRDDLLMRVDGGLFAIFPRSVYFQTRSGNVPVIPNDTTFYIGEPAFPLLPAAAGTVDTGATGPEVSRRDTRIDARLALRPRRSDVLGLRLMPRIDDAVDEEPEARHATLARPEERIEPEASPAPPSAEKATEKAAEEAVEEAHRVQNDRWPARIHQLMRRAAERAKRR